MKKIILFGLLVLFLFACFEPSNQIEAEQSIAVQFMKSANIDITHATCRVSASDMDTLSVYLTVTPTMISGEISNIPYGEGRLFEIMCYNSAGNMNYYGSSLVDINSLAPIVDIVLEPFNSEATVTIHGTFADAEETDEKIVFCADWNETYNTYIMDTDGTNIKQLTFSEYNDNCPKLSPDRQKVLYQRFSEVGHQIFVVDVNTLEETMLPLVDYSPHTGTWHPEENKILFVSDINGSADIFEYNMDINLVTCLIQDESRNWGPDYSADGEYFVYYSDKTGTFRAYISDKAGESSQLIGLEDSVYLEEKSPCLNSQDDNLFVFAGRGYSETSSMQWGVFVLDRSTSVVQNIISTVWVDENRPCWSPNGNSIIYEHYDGVNHGLYMINADGSQNEAIIDTDGNERYPDWR